jgi:hypothetical protein
MDKSFHERLSARHRLATLWCLCGHTIVNFEQEATKFEICHRLGYVNLRIVCLNPLYCIYQPTQLLHQTGFLFRLENHLG